MNASVIQTILREILALAIPAIQNLIESKVVPTLKRKAYERLDDFASDRIEDLSELLIKIKSTDNKTKKQAHIEGFKLGLSTIKAIGEKLVEGAIALEKEM